MSLMDEVKERWPGMAPLMAEPTIGGLFRRAVDNEWSAAKFQSELVATKWFRSQSEAGRRRTVLWLTDPTQAKEERKQFVTGLDQLGRQLGISLSKGQKVWMAEAALRGGISDPTHSTIMAMLRSQGQRQKDWGHGQIGLYTQQIKAERTGQFFEPISNKEARRLALDVATGYSSMDGVRSQSVLKAEKRFPHMADLIRQGQTPAQIIAPLREIVANELELGGAENVDVMNNPTWRYLLGIMGKDKKMRMLTESEAQRLARSQPQWWKTAKGRQLDAQSASAMLQLFGARAF